MVRSALSEVVVGPGFVAFVRDVEPKMRRAFEPVLASAELEEEFAGWGCAPARTPACADLIMDNLDDWAAWYRNRQ